MKTLGIIGGIGPESTIEYYRQIIAAYRERIPDGSYPSIVIDSVDLNKIVGLLEANDLRGVATYLTAEVRRLASAGAEVGLLAANTPHLVFGDVQRQSPIPLVSIVEATCDAAMAMGLKRLALLGTRFTMEAAFYPQVFDRAGISLRVPDPDERAYVHEKYMGELVPGIILPETRVRLLAIVARLQKREGIEGVILGGTELPLILQDGMAEIPFLDTTRIHVNAAVGRCQV